jgi:hypothetical protein
MTGMKTYHFTDTLFNIVPGDFIHHLLYFLVPVDNSLCQSYRYKNGENRNQNISFHLKWFKVYFKNNKMKNSVVLCASSVTLCETKKELTQRYTEKHRVTQRLVSQKAI